MGQVGSSWVEMGPTERKLVQMGGNGSKYIQIHPTCLMQVPKGQSRCKQVQTGANGPNIVDKCFKVVFSGLKR